MIQIIFLIAIGGYSFSFWTFYFTICFLLHVKLSILLFLKILYDLFRWRDTIPRVMLHDFGRKKIDPVMEFQQIFQRWRKRRFIIYSRCTARYVHMYYTCVSMIRLMIERLSHALAISHLIEMSVKNCDVA